MKKILVVIVASLYLMSPQANSETISGIGLIFSQDSDVWG